MNSTPYLFIYLFYHAYEPGKPMPDLDSALFGPGQVLGFSTNIIRAIKGPALGFAPPYTHICGLGLGRVKPLGRPTLARPLPYSKGPMLGRPGQKENDFFFFSYMHIRWASSNRLVVLHGTKTY